MTRQIPQEETLKYFLDPVTGKVFDSLTVPAPSSSFLEITQIEARTLRKQTHHRRIAWAKKAQATAVPTPSKAIPAPESRDPQ